MYYSESMIQMVEDLHRQASEMEKEVKDMMELEGRAMGIELDKRKSVRDLFNELNAHSHDKAQDQAMTWAYVPCDMAEQDPNCYPVEEFVEAPVVEEHVEEHVHHEEHVEEHVDHAEEHVEEHVEPAPVHDDAPVDAEPHEFVESPAVPDAPAEDHSEG
tara:strand:- start:280 stop:756 length:477 start_codon:yes stop_codon:yes gene_type:complete